MHSTDPSVGPPPDGDTAGLSSDAANDAIAEPQTHAFSFTGSGSEYFRIWIVNLFLSVVTLGVYSAWAKVRRLQYFDRNTQLAGASFDFDGDPKAILRGRVLAVALLAAYHYAFGFSLAVGLAVVTLLLIALPFMMRGALRFRLRNTRYRGLRFNFSGSGRGAYAAYLPPVLLFFAPAALLAIDPTGAVVGVFLLGYLAWPLMHGAMKRYQHRHLEFGSQRASFDIKKRKFFRPYLAVVGLWIAAVIIISLAVTGATFAIASGSGPELAAYAQLAAALALIYVFYLVAGPYVQVRVGNMVWSGTSFPGITISSHLKARGYVRLQSVNALLTVLSVGLYRPFAVVRAYEYRLAHMTVQTHDNFERIAAGVTQSSRAASSDGVADFLGVDLSW
ncbi:YjgN family protein [Massilia soli]|uniref:DUF898 domain-containing protein n=1 Tax=Massilia soli TaxID=2792854 RepID=A0ABS7SVC2_9BURK|nr:YjgN family protein [Massilia soli]MBZ2209879.1 DUF898 domain-containing protein [Massilia soli]